MKNKFKVIIFDLDGTIMDTEGYQWDGWVEVMRNYGIELIDDDYLEYAGCSGSIIDEKLINRFALSVPLGQLVKEKSMLIMEWFKEKELNFMPFAKEAIIWCKEKGYRVALCSGGSRDEVMIKLERKNLESCFEKVVAGSDVSRSKPFPDVYLKMIDELNVNKEDCLAIEDTQFGMESAKNAGLCCFAVPHCLSIDQDFSRADKVLKSLKEVINYLDE